MLQQTGHPRQQCPTGPRLTAHPPGDDTMKISSWIKKLFKPGGRPTAGARRDRDGRPRLERLEDRTLPATGIHVIFGPTGAGDQDAAFLAGGGQLPFAAADTARDTLSTGALQSIASTANIVVEATQAI